MIHRARIARSRVILLAALTLAGCSPGAEAPPSVPASAEASFLQENEKAMAAMMSGMAAKPTGDVDKDFAMMMIPHHQGAIDMAKSLLKYGKNEELKALARDIVDKQADEIALMRRVVGDLPPAPADGAMATMPAHKM